MLAETVVVSVAAVTLGSLWLADRVTRLVLQPDPKNLPQEVTARVDELKQQRAVFESHAFDYRKNRHHLLADRAEKEAVRCGREIDRLLKGGRR